MTFHSLLAVTDFSTQGDRALHRAALIAAEHGATLTLLHFFRPGDARPPDAAVRLEHHALQLQQRHQVRTRVVASGVGAMEDVAREAAGADLIVWGSAPAQGLRAALAAHPVTALLRRCLRPVIVVHAPADAGYQRLVVAVDFSDASRGLVDVASALHASAPIKLFHAVSTAHEGKLRYAEVSNTAMQAYRQACRSAATAQLVSLADSYDARRNRLATALGRGDPARQVLVQQQHTAADLVVIGKRPASLLADLVCSSVAQRVLRLARTDVLVVPHGVQTASRASAMQRLAPELAVRRVRAGAPRPPRYPNPAAQPGRA